LGAFHDRCDGHANTLTLIKDTQGNIFGGFTPVEWETTSGGKYLYKADPSGATFLFTLTNPHNFPAKRFALKAEEKDKALYCAPGRGPAFYDVRVATNKRPYNAGSTSNFGSVFANDTGLDGKTFFTGSKDFIANEIEVFEITD
jgi:hypothetical protein